MPSLSAETEVKPRWVTQLALSFDHRLVVAAYEVCGTAADVDLAGQNQVRACRSDVLAKARAESGELASRGGSIFVAAAR